MSQPLFAIASPHRAHLAEMIDVVPSGTVSRTLLKLPDFKQVAFAMDTGQELSEHRTPMLAIVQPIDGTGVAAGCVLVAVERAAIQPPERGPRSFR